MDKIRLVALASFFAIMPFLITLSYAKEKTPVSVGMTKEELFKVYPQEYQVNYFQKFNDEIYTFNDYLTQAQGDTVTFYLKDGKVVWWDKEKANPTPEERLKEITERSRHAQPETLENDRTDAAELKKKNADRLDATTRTQTKKYNKERYGY